MNSDRSVQSITINFPSNAVIQNLAFRDVDYHSGEPYAGHRLDADRDADVRELGVPDLRGEPERERAPLGNDVRILVREQRASVVADHARPLQARRSRVRHGERLPHDRVPAAAGHPACRLHLHGEHGRALRLRRHLGDGSGGPHGRRRLDPREPRVQFFVLQHLDDAIPDLDERVPRAPGPRRELLREHGDPELGRAERDRLRLLGRPSRRVARRRRLDQVPDDRVGPEPTVHRRVRRDLALRRNRGLRRDVRDHPRRGDQRDQLDLR